MSSVQSDRPDRALSLSWSLSSDSRPEAYDLYRAAIADLYAVSDAANDHRLPFHNATTVHLFGDSTLNHARSSAQTLTRTAQEIRRSDLDHVYVILNRVDTVADCDGRSVRAEAGSVQFRDLSRPSSARTTIDTVNAMVPRAMVPAWLRDNRLHGLTLPAASPGGRLVASHLSTLADIAPQITEEEGIAALEATFVIAERFLGKAAAVAPAHSDAIHRTIRRRAMALIDASRLEGRLDVDRLARGVGVSRTGLYRAFDTMGGVRAYVLERRLTRAHAALRARIGTQPSIAAIAERHGFASRAEFNAAFRARFGVAPSDVPPALVVAEATDAPGQTVVIGALHDVALDWVRGVRTV